MAVRIRLKRLGRRHRPFFRVSVMDARSPRDGKTIEDLGTYDPMVRKKSDRVQLNMDRIDYWMSVGALPTEKVATLIKKVKENKFGEAAAPPPMTAPKQPEPEEAPAEEAAASEDAPAEESGEEKAEESSAETPSAE